MVGALAIETTAACAGLSSSQGLTEAQRGKITLPTRWGGYSTPLADSYFYSCALPPLVLVLELLLYMCAGVSLSLSL